MTEEPGRAEGLFESLRNLARTSLAIVQTRIEIFASEIDEVVLFWDTDRLLAISVLAGVFAVGGIAACLGLRAAISQRPKFLSATLAELRKDRTKLEGP